MLKAIEFYTDQRAGASKVIFIDWRTATVEGISCIMELKNLNDSKIYIYSSLKDPILRESYLKQYGIAFFDKQNSTALLAAALIELLQDDQTS